jgi:hypothetical protein
MLVTVLGTLLLAGTVSDSVKADLNSPIYAVREKARDALLSAFVPTPRNKWDALVGSMDLQTGGPAADVQQACRAHGIPLQTINTEAPYTTRVRLDRCWVLVCHLWHNELETFYVACEPVAVSSGPPPGFTGLWRIYCENGALLSETNYAHGLATGPLGDGDRTTMELRTERAVETTYP